MRIVKTPHDIPSNTPSHYLTAAELRLRWKVSGMFLWRLRRDGRLPIYKIGARGVRYAMTDILKIESESVVQQPHVH